MNCDTGEERNNDFSELPVLEKAPFSEEHDHVSPIVQMHINQLFDLST